MPTQREYRIRYYLGALDFWRRAISLQLERCHSEGQDGEVGRIDMNFYVVSVMRLREVAHQARTRLGMTELSNPINLFDHRWPKFREMRHRQEHHRDPAVGFPSDTWYFTGKIVDLKPGGRVEYIVDIDMMEPYVEQLHAATVAALQAELEKLNSHAPSAIKADTKHSPQRNS